MVQAELNQAYTSQADMQFLCKAIYTHIHVKWCRKRAANLHEETFQLNYDRAAAHQIIYSSETDDASVSLKVVES